jgi:hypothetical protein
MAGAFPFLISTILVAISLYIRLKMKESPIFQQIKSAGMSSTQPLTDAFTKWPNLKNVLISLFGATAGQGVVWYTGQFYALFYLQSILKINPRTANIVIAIALLLGMPFFTVVGALSDRIGRKKLMMAGCLLAVVTYIPIYKAMNTASGNHVLSAKSAKNKVTGAIALTPLTVDSTGASVPVKEATNPNLTMLVLLVFIQVLYVCLVYGPIAAYLIEAFPRQGAIHVVVLALSHRQRHLRRSSASDRPVHLRGHRQHLRRPLLPHGRSRHDLHSRQPAAKRNPRQPHLG